MDVKLEKKPFLERYKYRLAGGVLITALLIYLFFMSVAPSRMRQNRDNLLISEAKNDKFMEYLDLEGIVQPKLTIKLNSMEYGIVNRIVAEDGSQLKKGDTILVLYNPELVRSIEDSRDELEKQRISYKEKLLQMEQNSSALKRSTIKTSYDLSRLAKQYELDKEEFSMGIKSKAQLDVSTDEYNYNLINASLLLNEQKQDSVKNIYQKELLKSDMNLEERRFIRNRERLVNLAVLAPIDGQLSYLSVIPGERVVAGSNIGELKNMDDFKVKASISEYYIDRIYLGLSAVVVDRDERYPLVISRINPEVKERNFEIDLLFTGKVPENIRIGKSCRLQIELGQPESAMIIDRGSFYQNTGGQWIFRLNKNGTKAERIPISIGRQNPLQYEVLSGLKAGDKVIVSGYDNFADVQELILEGGRKR